QLAGVLGQAVAAVAEAGVVVVGADACVVADAFDDLAGVQAVGGAVGVQLVDIGPAHGQVGVGEQFVGLGFRAVGEQDGRVVVCGALFEQPGEGACPFALFADDDARGVEVVVQRLAFTQEFGAE